MKNLLLVSGFVASARGFGGPDVIPEAPVAAPAVAMWMPKTSGKCEDVPKCKTIMDPQDCQAAIFDLTAASPLFGPNMGKESDYFGGFDSDYQGLDEEPYFMKDDSDYYVTVPQGCLLPKNIQEVDMFLAVNPYGVKDSGTLGSDRHITDFEWRPRGLEGRRKLSWSDANSFFQSHAGYGKSDPNAECGLSMAEAMYHRTPGGQSFDASDYLSSMEYICICSCNGAKYAGPGVV